MYVDDIVMIAETEDNLKNTTEKLSGVGENDRSCHQKSIRLNI